jgi:hypothetical protein
MAKVETKLNASASEPESIATLDPRTSRFVDDVCSVHDMLRFSRLVDLVEKATAKCYVVRRHGVVTIAARTCDIPHRYLIGILGFRLAQYLAVGFASAKVTAKRGLFCEPMGVLNPEDWHVIALHEETGQILGYVELAGPQVGVAIHAADSNSGTLPVEHSHGVDLLSAFGVQDRLPRRTVREVKRFVHRRSMTDRALRLRVSLECLLALTRVVESHFPDIAALVGDAESHVALRHVILLGLEVRVLVGTTPSLPEEDLMHPAYVIRSDVKPFFAEVPDLGEIRRRAAVIDSVLDNSDIFADIALLGEAMQGSVEHVHLSASAA